MGKSPHRRLIRLLRYDLYALPVECRSRPIWTFSHGDFPFPLLRISACFKHFGLPGVKRWQFQACRAQLSTSSRGHSRISVSDTDRLQDKLVKAHHMLPVIGSDLVPDSAVADVTVLPATIQPFKSVPREPAPHLVAENQISLAYFSVAILLPRLPHSEVPKQVLGNVRFERNLHEGMKDFRGLWEVQIGPGSVDQPELAKLTEQREVAVQVTDEIREPRW